MCRAGGRRCPSHSDPEAIAARNARRRALYAQNKKKKKSDYFETGDDFLNKLINDPYSEVINIPADNTPTEKPKKKVAAKKPTVKKTVKKTVASSVAEDLKVSEKEKALEGMIVENKVQEKVSESAKKELKEFELLDMEELESSDVSNLYGGESVSLLPDNGAGASWDDEEKEYSNEELFFNKGLKKYNPDLNVEISENEGYLVDTLYLSSKKVSGVLDYTKLSEIDDSELGFNKMSKEGESYELKTGDHTTLKNYYSLSRKEMSLMSNDDKAALRYFTSENYKWLNRSLFDKKTPKNKNKKDYAKYGSFAGFVEDTQYNYEDKNIDSLKKITKQLDEALEKTPKKQKVLYRGVNEYAPMYGDKSVEDWVSENYSVGKEVVFDGYQSASANPAPALNFSSHGGIVYEILTPEGANVSSESEYDSEAEITLPRAQRYTVSSIQKRTISNGHFDYERVTIIRLIAINSKGEVLDGTNSEKPAEITDDYFTEFTNGY